jgi:hypothetical protein
MIVAGGIGQVAIKLIMSQQTVAWVGLRVRDSCHFAFHPSNRDHCPFGKRLFVALDLLLGVLLVTACSVEGS